MSSLPPHQSTHRPFALHPVCPFSQPSSLSLHPFFFPPLFSSLHLVPSFTNLPCPLLSSPPSLFILFIQLPIFPHLFIPFLQSPLLPSPLHFAPFFTNIQFRTSSPSSHVSHTSRCTFLFSSLFPLLTLYLPYSKLSIPSSFSLTAHLYLEKNKGGKKKYIMN